MKKSVIKNIMTDDLECDQMLEMQPAFVSQKRSEFSASFHILQTEMIFLGPNRNQIYLLILFDIYKKDFSDIYT